METLKINWGRNIKVGAVTCRQALTHTDVIITVIARIQLFTDYLYGNAGLWWDKYCYYIIMSRAWGFAEMDGWMHLVSNNVVGCDGRKNCHSFFFQTTFYWNFKRTWFIWSIDLSKSRNKRKTNLFWCYKSQINKDDLSREYFGNIILTIDLTHLKRKAVILWDSVFFFFCGFCG